MKFKTKYSFNSDIVREHINSGEYLVDIVHKSYKKLIQEAILSGTFAQLLNAKAYYELEGNRDKLDELYRVCSDLSDEMVVEKNKFFGGDVVDFASLTDSYINLINDAYAQLTSSYNNASEPAYTDSDISSHSDKKDDVPPK